MKSIKLILTAFAIFCCAPFIQKGNLSAQNAYLAISPSYNFPFGGENIGFDLFTGSSNDFVTKRKTGSLGSGLTINASGGIFFSGHAGLDLNVQYLLGRNQLIYSDRDDSTGYLQEQFRKSSQVSITPSVIFRSAEEGISLYTKTGLTIAIVNGWEEELHTFPDRKNSSDENVLTTKFSGALALGFSAAMGIDIPVNESISIFGELSAVYLRSKPSKSTVIAYTVNGEDKLSSLETSDIETVYHESVDQTSNGYGVNDPNRASDRIAFTVPFHRVGIGAGLRIRL